MRVTRGNMVALGYGKYFRSESVVGLAPIEQDRGPGRRTFVYVEGLDEPMVASRSESAILRDMTGQSGEITKASEQQQLLSEILDAVGAINPTLRSILRDQGSWDIDRLEERLRDVLEEARPAAT
jgi:hypothetical protein